MTAKPSSRERSELYTGAVLVCLVVTILSSFIAAQLWLDEGVTFWVIKDGLAEASHRIQAYQNWSPLYYYSAWFLKSIFGTSELGLRIPSIIEILIAALFGALIARQAFNQYAAPLFIVLFFGLDAVQLAFSARPYALALMFCSISFWSLMSWCNAQWRGYLLVYTFSLAAMIYSHLLFVFAALPHLVLVWSYKRRDTALNLKALFGAWLLAGLILVPGFLKTLSVFGQRETWKYLNLPSADALFRAYFPNAFMIVVFFTLIFSKVTFKECSLNIKTLTGSREFPAILSMYLLGPLILYLLSIAGGQQLLVDRYYTWLALGLALLCAGLISGITDNKVRMATLMVLSAFFMGRSVSRQWNFEGWKEAAIQINESSAKTPVTLLLQSGLVEGNRVDWLTDPEKSSYLQAPFSYYPLVAKIISLPPRFSSPDAQSYFRDKLLPQFKGGQQVFLLEYRASDSILNFPEVAAIAHEMSMQTKDLRLTRFNQ